MHSGTWPTGPDAGFPQARSGTRRRGVWRKENSCGTVNGVWCGIVQSGGVMRLQGELIKYVAKNK